VGYTPEKRRSMAMPTDDSTRRIFLSASFLSKQYRQIPDAVLDSAMFFFGSRRSWMFPKTREEMIEARSQPAKYLEVDEDCKSLILKKEAQGLVYWFLPSKDYQGMSQLLEDTQDPTSEESSLPLLLDEEWWRTGFVPGDAKYTDKTEMIISNFKSRGVRVRCGNGITLSK
jgi:hypothetical protein